MLTKIKKKIFTKHILDSMQNVIICIINLKVLIVTMFNI